MQLAIDASSCRSNVLSFFAMPRIVWPSRSRTVTARYGCAAPRPPRPPRSPGAAGAAPGSRSACSICAACPVAADVRKVGTEHTAAAPHHVAARAVPLAGEESLARREVARNARHARSQEFFKLMKYAAIASASASGMGRQACRHRECPCGSGCAPPAVRSRARPAHIDDVGTVASTASVLAMASAATRQELPLSVVIRLGDGGRREPAPPTGPAGAHHLRFRSP